MITWNVAIITIVILFDSFISIINKCKIIKRQRSLAINQEIIQQDPIVLIRPTNDKTLNKKSGTDANNRLSQAIRGIPEETKYSIDDNLSRIQFINLSRTQNR